MTAFSGRATAPSSRSPRCEQAGLRSCRTRCAGSERRGRPAVFGPDAETEGDLAVIAAGLAAAEAKGCDVIVRCAPAFAGVLAGTTARGPAPLPGGKRVLVVCGSYVPQTTRQLARLRGAYPEAVLEADVGALVDGDHEAEARRLSRLTSELLDRIGLAVVATPRERPGDGAVARGRRPRRRRASPSVVTGVVPHPDVIVAKGGITAAVTLARRGGRRRSRGRRPRRARRLALVRALAGR